MGKRRGTLTAAELVEQLASDSDYQAKLAARVDRAEKLARACAEDERGLLDELYAAGVTADSVWDFVALGGAPPTAIPILTAHLSRSHHPRIWEGIVRALSTNQARERAFDTLVEAYRLETDSDRRWVLANAMGSMARLAEVRDLPGIEMYHTLFRQSRKPPHRDPAI